MTVSPEDEIEVRGDQLAYVSRGGCKLEKAVREFGLRLDGKICMDIGASTGGFTDCMLQNGASKVYSIDVGYGQSVVLNIYKRFLLIYFVPSFSSVTVKPSFFIKAKAISSCASILAISRVISRLTALLPYFIFYFSPLADER